MSFFLTPIPAPRAISPSHSRKTGDAQIRVTRMRRTVDTRRSNRSLKPCTGLVIHTSPLRTQPLGHRRAHPCLARLKTVCRQRFTSGPTTNAYGMDRLPRRTPKPFASRLRIGLSRESSRNRTLGLILQSLSSLKYFKTPANLAVSLRIARYKSIQAAAQCDWHMPLLWPRAC